MAMLVQTLVLRDCRVLLGRWKTGPFFGRITGLLGSTPGTCPESAAVAICQPHLTLDPRRLRRRGIFRFQELDESHASAVQLGDHYREHQMLYRLHSNEDVRVQASDDFEPIGWFGKGDIPFDDMPEDDEVWYNRVLFDDTMLRGHFTFRGTSMEKHSLEEVTPEEGLCETLQLQQPLLLHNPECSKSRALKEALEASRAAFGERHYLEDPLTLSELEVLSARLKADDGNFTTSMLCREDNVGEKDDDILEAVALQPKLMQRPVLVTGSKAALGRPKPEDALRLLS